jgi:pimeloyl-ACP methyl ester carboxylesterase
VEQLANDLDELLERLAVGAAIAIGHSLGAAIVAQLAASSHRLSHAVFLGGPAFGALNRRWGQFLDDLLSIGGDRAIDLIRLPSALSVLPPHMLQVDVVVEMVFSDDVGLGTDVRGLKGHIGASMAWHERDPVTILEQCTIPSLMIAFSEDVHSPPDRARAAAAAAGLTRFVEISGHGHAGMQTAATEVRDAVIEFVQVTGHVSDRAEPTTTTTD